jgi:hypothetical protein
MRMPSLKRQEALLADLSSVAMVRSAATDRFGANALAQSPTLMWTMRNILGVMEELPFSATVSTNLSEWMWVVRHEEEIL